MRCDDLLTRMRGAGMAPVEEDYLDDYGSFAARRHERLANRRFRCTYGRARVDGVPFEAYNFASEEEAVDFLDLVGDDGGRWARRRNVLIRVPSGAGDLLERVRDRVR